MASKLRGLAVCLVSFLLGALYAALIGLIGHHLRAPLVAWPVTTALFWFVLSRFNLLRFAGYLAAPPVAILAFEIIRTFLHPVPYAYRYMSLDRSHYLPGVRLDASYDEDMAPPPGSYDSGVQEIFIGKDGFRADPATGQGNPERCRLVLIGDSMIYGSGLPYSDTLRPALAAMGADACVFGVTGNAPIDYVSTLKHVAYRIEHGAHIAVYVYAYNDFVTVNKFIRRRLRAVSNSFKPLAQLIAYADDWRRTTFTYSLFRRGSTDSTFWLPLREILLDDTKTLKVYSRRDPISYTPPPPLNKGQRSALRLSLRELRHVVHNQPWHVSIVILPDNDEVMANLARRSAPFVDLDPRRADALEICRAFLFGCEDLTQLLYQRVRAEGANSYFADNRHFSAFGTRVVAEHLLAATKRAGAAQPATVGPTANQEIQTQH